MQNWKIDFLDKLLPKKQDDGNYYLLTYNVYEDKERYNYDCVICNDERYEIIELSVFLPKEL